MSTNQNIQSLFDQTSTKGLSKFFSLKTKATLFAIAIGIIPVAAIGSLSYIILNRSVTEEISQQQLEKTQIAGDSLGRFLDDRIREINALSENAIFTDSKFRNAATLEEKTAVLNNFAKELEYYNSVLFFDLQGDLLFQASIEKPYTKNYGDKKYFKEAIATEAITINGPGLSSSSGQLRVEFAVPVKDRVTGKLIGVIRAKIPGKYINSLFDVYQEQNKHWYLINEEGTIFAGDLEQQLNQPLFDYFPKVEPLHQAKKSGVFKSQTVSSINSKETRNKKRIHQRDEKQLISYAVAEAPEQFPNLHIGTLLTLDEEIAFASVRQLGLIVLLGTTIAAITVAAIAIYLADRVTIPLIEAVTAVKKIGSGELNTRLKVKRNDELGELNININLMAEQLQSLLKEQDNLTRQTSKEKEQLETAIYTLIDEISDATEGDLTVRAKLDSLELSTVADLFNAIIDNLQEIAIAAKDATSKVENSLTQNETAIRSLAEQAISEARETRNTLISVEQMSESIQAVAQNANQAEQITNHTYNKIVQSTKDMNLTVNSILKLRDTVGDTVQKMQLLDESSQEISKVVTLIEEISLKTQVLAINASAEAERAGEYGQGFAVVAEQVGSLAQQVGAATQEIAKIVTSIQIEAKQVTQAMKLGTDRVLDSSSLVESAQASLVEVLKESSETNKLINSISQSTVSQADTSQNVTNLMQKIARLSETTSKSSQEVAESIVETARVAAKLQSTVAQFKVAE